MALVNSLLGIDRLDALGAKLTTAKLADASEYGSTSTSCHGKKAQLLRALSIAFLMMTAFLIPSPIIRKTIFDWLIAAAISSRVSTLLDFPMLPEYNTINFSLKPYLLKKGLSVLLNG